MLVLFSFLPDDKPSFFLAAILGDSLATFLALALDFSLVERFLEDELWLLFTSFLTFFFPYFLSLTFKRHN
jgi:hypothetical protein